AVEKLIATRDSDEDECLSMAELLPGFYDPNFGGFRPRPLPRVPGGTDNIPSAASLRDVVRSVDGGKIPGLITQQIIKKYDKDGDFELTKEEIGFDDATFKRLDKDGNGKLDGEEFDVWRTGPPDLEVTLSIAPKATDCVAKIVDEKGAAARGFKF